MDSGKIKILIVEDNPGDARFILEMLTEGRLGGHEAETVETLESAVSRVNSKRFDVIILDLNLPDSGGLETLDRVLAASGGMTPVIILTGLSDETQGGASIGRGAEDYLVKGSIDPAQLSRSVRYAIERAGMQRSLRERELQWTVTFNAISSSVLLVNPDGLILNHNTASESMLGKTSEELIGHYCCQVVHGQEESIVECPLTRARESKLREKSQVRVGERWLEITVDPILDERNDMTGAVHIMEDITERVRAEESLRIRGAAIENAANAIVITDRRGIIQYVNPSFERLTGYESREAAGKNPGDLIKSGLHGKAFYRDMWDVILSGRTWQGDIVNRRRDGRLYNEEMTIAPVMGPEGDISHFIAIKQDVTERKIAEEKILSSLKEKETLLKEVHHRVKNNLQIVVSLLGLQAGDEAGGRESTMLMDIRNRIMSMAVIHEKLYMSANFSEIDFHDYIRTISENLFMTFGVDRKRITLKTDFSDIRIGIDYAVPCGLIINELVTNSLKHAFPGNMTGEIAVSMTGEKGGGYVISVRDTGAGLPADFDMDKVSSLGLRLVTVLSL